MSGLTFDADEHRYFLDGEELPSVTTVIRLAGLIDDTHFDDWYAQRGSAVHKACELLDRGQLDRGSVDQQIEGFFEAWVRFISDMNPEWLAIEKRVSCHVWRYAGTLDRYGHVNGNSRPVVLDIKTGDPGRAVAIQLSAYAQALDTSTPCDLMAVQLKDDGQYRCTTYPLTETRRHFAIFTSALNLLRWKGEIPA